jgi:hypothetical protein
MNYFAGLQVVAVCLTLAGPSSKAPPADERNRDELRRITQELLDAIAPGKAEVWDRYLDALCSHGRNGTVRSQEFLRRSSRFPRVWGTDRNRQVSGDAASFTAVLPTRCRSISTTTASNSNRFRAVDRMSTPDGWRLIGHTSPPS